LTSELWHRPPTTCHLEGAPAYRGGIAHHHAQRYQPRPAPVLENRCAAAYLLLPRCVAAELHPSGHEQMMTGDWPPISGCFPIKLNRWPGHCAAGWLIGYIADHDPVPTAPLVHPGDPAAETVGSTSAQSDVGIGIAGDPRCAAVPIARLELLPWPIARGVRSGQYMVGCRCGVLREKSRRQNIRWRAG